MEVLLVRHGESLDNVESRVQGWSGSGLSERGRLEAAATAKYLATQRVVRIVTSDLRRASETATILAARLGLEAEPDEAFREMRLGPWEGRTMREVEKTEPLAIWSWRYDGRKPAREGIESVGAVLARVLGGLERIRTAPAAGRTAVVSHGGALSITLTHLLGLDCVRIWQMPTANGSISRIRWEHGAWRVVSWNETGHLKGVSLPHCHN